MPLIVENGCLYVVDEQPSTQADLEWEADLMECPHCQFQGLSEEELASHVITEHDEEVPPVDAEVDEEGVYSVTTMEGDSSE